MEAPKLFLVVIILALGITVLVILRLRAGRARRRAKWPGEDTQASLQRQIRQLDLQDGRPAKNDHIRAGGQPQPATVDFRGDQPSRYRLLEQLGSGGMGTVYKAYDPQLDRVVAVKFPRFDGSPEEVANRRRRFEREARAAAQVWHPHVCPIYDVGELDGRPFVVMAFVDGPSLAQRLAADGCFENPTDAVALIRQVLDGLDAVHARGILHRDIKPANILLDAAGRALLTDFGLARPDDADSALTSEGVILGTPAYMAPEQAAARPEQIGAWTDVYAVGVVLYQMATGHLPFEGAPLQVLAQLVHAEPARPSAWRPGLDPALEAILLRVLAKKPAERFASAREFAAALEDWTAAARRTTAAVTPPPRAS